MATLRPAVSDRYLMLPSQYTALLDAAKSRFERLARRGDRPEFASAAALLADELTLLGEVSQQRKDARHG